MPVYTVEARHIDFLREAVILDTNVLVKAFYRSDPDQKDVRYFLDEFPYQWLVPSAVVVETWGLIVGSKRDWRGGYEFLAWLNNPGTDVIIIPEQGMFDREKELTERMQVDCVDAILAHLAHDISDQCSLKPAIKIATYDTRDFWKLTALKTIRMNILDMNSLSEIEFDN